MSGTILVIDDSPTIRMSVEFAINELNYNIIQAENGVDAFQKLDLMKDKDDLLLCICDINMPKMNGIEFIKEFRKKDKFTPVIVLTTETEQAQIEEGRDAGASGWLIKPFKPDSLVGVVKKFLR